MSDGSKISFSMIGNDLGTPPNQRDTEAFGRWSDGEIWSIDEHARSSRPEPSDGNGNSKRLEWSGTI